MCENVLCYTTSEPISTLAQAIICQQTQGIAKIKSILCPCGRVCNRQQEVCCYRRRNV